MNNPTLQSMMALLIIAILILIIYYMINIGNRFAIHPLSFNIDRAKWLRYLILIGIALIVILLFYQFSILRDMVFTLVLSAIMAYIINPLMVFIETKGIRRSFAILMIYLAVISLVVLLSMLVIPKTITELKNLIITLPSLLDRLITYFNELNNQVFKNNEVLQNMLNNFNAQLRAFIQGIQEGFFSFLSNFAQSATGMFSKLVRLILVPVVTFYFLLDKDLILNKIIHYIPWKYKDGFLSLSRDTDAALSNFVRVRLMMALFVGIITTLVLFVMGIDFALVIGLITTIADVVPYIGPFLGFVPAVLIALFQSPIKAISVAMIFVLIQWVENNIIGPKLLGSSTGIHPLIVLLSLIIGGGIFGVVGMIFSVPVIATLKILHQHFFESIKTRFRGDNQSKRV